MQNTIKRTQISDVEGSAATPQAAEAEVVELFLSSKEVEELTGRKRPTRQVQALRGMGIENRLNPAGRVIVSRRHLEELLGAKSGRRTQTRSIEPDWSALNHAKASSKRK